MTNPIFITGNLHKAQYLARVLDMQIDHKKVELDEIQSTDLHVIVEHKVRQAYEIVKQPVLVEDVALGFDELGGLPGPFVKYLVEASDGLEKMCRILDPFSSRGATASCVFGYFDGKRLELLRGELHGEIAHSPRGDKGFGWDKIFCPDGYDGKTRAELNEQQDELTYKKIKAIDELACTLRELGYR